MVLGTQASVDELLDGSLSGRRIGPEEGVRLYQEADLLSLGMVADALRKRRVQPADRVTYLIDRNINFTNVCVTDCLFCAFYRAADHPESYVLTREAIGQKLEELQAIGGTRVLLQGGHHPSLPLEWYEDLLRWLRAAYPTIELNAFSPPEIDHLAALAGLSTVEVLTRLQQAGLEGLPGGGAEMLDDDVRRRVSPKKLRTDGWLRIMEEAQALGLATTATMVIGFGETVEQRVGHLARLRTVQDRSLAAHGNGFTAFISWTLQVGNTPLARSKRAHEMGATSHEYLRHAAFARLFLDNFDHHQASWPTQGLKVAQVALAFGCDDLGSTMMEENVVSAAGSTTGVSVGEREIRRQIRGAGFIPAQRDTRYRLVGSGQ